jgi:transcriptional regulator with XRE-family HTH domain
MPAARFPTMPARRSTARLRATQTATPAAGSSRTKEVADAAKTPSGDVVGDAIGAAALGRRVAESLRKLRKDKRLSLDQLAAASGVSRAALSQIEGSRTNPTLSLLWKVAVGLGVPFQALLGSEQNGRPQVLRAGDSTPLRSSDGRMESRLLSPAGATENSDVYELKLLPRGIQRSEPHGQGTTEVLIILTGALRVIVADETYDLAPGDSMFFRADVPHSYESRSSHDTRCINIISYARS